MVDLENSSGFSSYSKKLTVSLTIVYFFHILKAKLAEAAIKRYVFWKFFYIFQTASATKSKLYKVEGFKEVILQKLRSVADTWMGILWKFTEKFLSGI